MRKSLATLLLFACGVCAYPLMEVSSHANDPAIKDPKDVRLGMTEQVVTAALQACCAARPSPSESVTGTETWDARDAVGQIWRVVFHNGVVVEITHEARLAGTLSAVGLLQMVTNDLVQHCPPDSRVIPGKRGPGFLDASAYQDGSPDLENQDKINWRSSVHFSCGTHMVSITELGNDRVQVSFGDAVPNPMAPRGFSSKPENRTSQ
jgi:hypothetical protein